MTAGGWAEGGWRLKRDIFWLTGARESENWQIPNFTLDIFWMCVGKSFSPSPGTELKLLSEICDLCPWDFKHSFHYCFQGTFIFSLVKYTPLKFNNTTEYPWWGYAVGWWFTLSSTLMVPIWMLYNLSVTPGTLRQVSWTPELLLLAVVDFC